MFTKFIHVNTMIIVLLMARRPPKGLIKTASWEATYTPHPNIYYIQVERECLHDSIKFRLRINNGLIHTV